MSEASFDSLSPETVVKAAEEASGLVLDGTFNPYPSYINRVYGLKSEEGTEVVAKFYRPGRWTREALLDEHRFLFDCAEAELPVVAPLRGRDGTSLFSCAVGDGGAGELFYFALFPKRGGRNFDAETDEDWLRLGSLAGRLHAVGKKRPAANRALLEPAGTAGFAKELASAGHVHPKLREEFLALCLGTVGRIAPLFQGLENFRLHGDCHRGNILDRPGTGLLLIDFDDLVRGPAVQDLWLLLPGYAVDSGRELELLLSGYESFTPFDRRSLALIEPLRFMRLVYFLAWRARQRRDLWFRASFPDWGNEAFWIKEVEDLRVQTSVIEDSLDVFGLS